MASGFAEDDDFDWESAVAEIDKACERARKTEASSHQAADENFGGHGRSSQVSVSQNPQSKTSRQQTLDVFLKPPHEDGHHRQFIDAQAVSNAGVEELLIDSAAASSWIYPANVSRRQYQFDITKTALFTNTIVSLPTGLGKTLIAAVVMYNFFRWFPEGKIVFTAPSRPLVLQQIEACHNIMGIPQVMSIDMTGQMTPSARAEYWKTRRVFFVTPQVLEKDMQSGTCPKHQIVCLVVDEAHRACGNYSYCVVVRELMAADVRLRILALTATPGSNQATIQAVVDNLQISRLEYRSDSDPDVRQYIHDRKLEVIQVAMNKECNQLKDRFLDVLQPVVSKLVSLHVFYSRDYARITPFEFLTARQRFREAPPPSLQSSKFGEVEAFFGAAITLYHVFKLLFSHGIRPALEMLQQKLEQPGLFLRMMGKNEKLLQIKQIMQQSVHHGAPSPKLEKLEQILVDHFNLHDPLHTRVIVFTNFRESVKDILSALARMQGTVKAMEFVGQSGKSSKGQTQKVQLAVLQKFRSGGFNTLVATCIAEEGLDIMEVDLVICFDANVSPLRMIQRMGRTGRKRDGRVVVLASEGTELQGYLAKQAKSKALGQHMHNGGVQSFNFHASPRMIPHRFKPEVQLVEMAIERFVHRGYKQKADLTIEDPGAAELTAEEAALLLKYSSSLNPFTPSLIAFPRFQLVPTPIYQIKHSFRTTSMLIDTFQSLRGVPDHEDSRISTPIDDEVPDSPPNEEPQEWPDELQDWPPDVDDNRTFVAGCWQPEDPVTSLSAGKNVVIEHNAVQEVESGRDDFPIVEVCRTASNRREEQHASASAVVHLDHGDTGIPDTFVQKVTTDLSSPHAGNVNFEVGCDGRSLDDSTVSKARLHRCLFSEGVVSVSSSGQVCIAPAPRLDSRANDVHVSKNVTRVLTAGDGTPGLHKEQQLLTCDTRKQQTVQLPSDQFCESDGCKFDVIVPSSVVKSKAREFEPVAMPAVCGSAHTLNGLLCVSPSQSRPGNCTVLPAASEQRSATAMGIVTLGVGAPLGTRPSNGDQHGAQVLSKFTSPSLQGCPEKFSPRLTSLADGGIVPVTPMLEMRNGGSPFLGITSTPPRYMFKQNSISSSQRLQDQSVVGNRTEVSKGSKKVESSLQAQPVEGFLSPIQPKTLAFHYADQSSLTAKGVSPSLKQTSNGTMDCQVQSSVPATAERPRKFKRLVKLRDVGPSTHNCNVSVQEHAEKGRGERVPSDGHNGRVKRCVARPFVDEEAEVSSSQECSSDEDLEGDRGEDLESFIDDGSNPSSATQNPPIGSADMMAVYRRSLLTPSPAQGPGAPWMRFAKGNTTPSTSGTTVSSSLQTGNSVSTRNTSPAGYSEGAQPVGPVAETPSCCAVSVAKIQSSCGEATAGVEARASCVKGVKDGVKEGSTCGRPDVRKRKLSFLANPRHLEHQGVAGGSALSPLAAKDRHSDLERQCAYLEDDIFDGLDLDALEAEAVEMSKARLATQPTGFTKCRASDGDCSGAGECHPWP